ncbi:sensor histidine kinase [Micromonospora sp. HM5-17]|uniref:sensor histidine kinase n=1 Tax=Micromonospora sp. HM5-17 TaxID=2487710 RepID=UPI0011CD706F|nr:histidine kinase [Micromonospora sp. HM5-17]
MAVPTQPPMRTARDRELGWLRWLGVAFVLTTYAPLSASLAHARAAAAVVVTGLTVVFVVSWVAVVWRSTPWRQRVVAPSALAVTLCSGAALTFAAPRQWLGTIPFLLVAALVLSSGPVLAVVWSIAVPAATMLVGIAHGMRWTELAEFAAGQAVLGVTLVATHSLARAVLLLRRLRRLAHEQGQEIERLRLAREIHDALGRDLLAVVLRTQMIADDPQTPPAIAAEARLAGEAARRALESVRTVVHDLHVNDLNDEVAQARDLLRTVGIELVVVGQVPAGRELAPVLREAVTNVVRHAAGARTCLVCFETVPGLLRMTVDDDGTGDTPIVAGQGIRGMQDRVLARSGRFEVRRRPGGGVRVLVEVPVTETQPDRREPAEGPIHVH